MPRATPRAVGEPPPPRRAQPLESHASSSADFKDLCYLLTCKSVQGVVRDWDGIISARAPHPNTLGQAPSPTPALARTLALPPGPDLLATGHGPSPHGPSPHGPSPHGRSPGALP